MPARDKFHIACRNALVKEGWTITHDPLKLTWGARDFFVDLGAEQLIGAEKEGRRIAVEVKSFVMKSDMEALELALGQYMVYSDVLKEIEPERILYLAVPEEVFGGVFEEPIGKLILKNHRVGLIGFDPSEEVIVQWMT